MPNVPWWKKSHASVGKYVRRKYKGNWDAYTRKWIKARSKLAKTYSLKKSVYLKSQDLRLGGDELKGYIDNVDTRIEIIKCLAKLNKTSKPKKEVVAAAANAPSFNCPHIPEVDWWGDFNHDNINSLVKRKYKGNWQRYVAFWEEEMDALMASFGLGQEAVVNKLGMELSNEELGLYVGKVAGMIAVVNCLAEDASKK